MRKSKMAEESLGMPDRLLVNVNRLSAIRGADIILVVKDGTIIGRDTHEELLTQRGYYYNIYTRSMRRN